MIGKLVRLAKKIVDMKISEVIKKLQEIQKEKGDLYVWVDSLDIEEFDYDDEILNITNGCW